MMRTNTKIALLLFMANLLIILLFGGGIYYFLDEYSYVDFYKRLETRATIAAKYNLETNLLNAEAMRTVRQQHLERLPQEHEALVEVPANDSLDAIARRSRVPVPFAHDVWNKGTATYKDGNTLYAGIRYAAGSKAYLVVVSANNYYSTHHLPFLRSVLLVGVLLIALITASLSRYLTKYIFAPIKHITDNVRKISTDNIHLRLEDAESNSEINELTSTFNDLLGRMETAFETQKNFVSNASHELGTPLTAIIGEADVALIKERAPAEYQEVLQKILLQAERLDEITKSLLFLAQTGYNGKNVSLELLRADELVWEVKEIINRINPGNEIQVDLSLFPDDPMKLKIRGNRQLLHLAIANILNNACKYSHNKPVSISVAATDQQVVMVIRDQGVGIPDTDLPFIYDPFFRATNTSYFEGYGIGLPLARNIVRLHAGTLDVSSVVNVGTTVQIRIPLA